MHLVDQSVHNYVHTHKIIILTPLRILPIRHINIRENASRVDGQRRKRVSPEEWLRRFDNRRGEGAEVCRMLLMIVDDHSILLLFISHHLRCDFLCHISIVD